MPQISSRVMVVAAAFFASFFIADSAAQSTTITISNAQPQKSSSAASTPEAAAKIAPDTPIVPLAEIQTRAFSSRALTDGGPQQQQQQSVQQQSPSPSTSSSSSSSSIPQPAKQLMSTKSEVWTASQGRAGGRGKYPSSMVPEENVPYSPSMYQAPIYKRSEYALSARGSSPQQGPPQNPPPVQSNSPPTSPPTQVSSTRPSPASQPQQPQSRSASSLPIGSLIAPPQDQQSVINQQQYASGRSMPQPPSSSSGTPSVQIVVTNRDQQQLPQQQTAENRLVPQYANPMPMMRPPPPPQSTTSASQPNSVDNSQPSIPQVIVDVGFPGGGSPPAPEPQLQQQAPSMYDPRFLSVLAAARAPQAPQVQTTTTPAPTIPPIPATVYFNDTLDNLVNGLQEKVSSVVDTMLTERDVRRRLELQLLINQNEIEKVKLQTIATRNDVQDMRVLVNQLEAELQSVHTVPRLAAASIPQESFALMGQQHVLQQPQSPQQQAQQAQQLQLQPQQFLGFPSPSNAGDQQNLVQNLQAATALQQQLQLGQQPSLQQQPQPNFAQDLAQFGGLLQPQQLLPVGHPQLVDSSTLITQQQQLPQQQLQPPPLQQPQGAGGPLVLGAANAVREELMSMINNLTRRMHEQQFMLTELLNGRIPVHSPDPLIRCHFERTANAGILHHNDKRLIVTDVRECLEACVNESSFLCRSVDFQRSSTKHPPGHTECLLSSRDHLTVPEESFNSYIGWDYFYKVCTPV